MRCGDTVKHNPSGETWTVAYVEGSHLSWVGWPYGNAKVADCTLLEECSDDEHLQLLKQIEASTGGDMGGMDRRPQQARYALEIIAQAADDDNFNKLTKDCMDAQTECARTYKEWHDATEHLKKLEELKRVAWMEIIDRKILGTGIAA